MECYCGATYRGICCSKLTLVQQPEFHDPLTIIMGYLHGPHASITTQCLSRRIFPLVLFIGEGEQLSIPPSSILGPPAIYFPLPRAIANRSYKYFSGY
ncbi:MAG: hypothetical protein HW387_1496 [Parachlamydiales bacterium]|nr:hypothetical protein [Parachlamydiales bacterium]